MPFLQNSQKYIVIRSIDKFSCRISTRKIILVVEGRECDENIVYTSELYEPGQKCTEAEYCMPSCFNVKTLPYFRR